MRKIFIIIGCLVAVAALGCISAPQPPAPSNSGSNNTTQPEAEPGFPEKLEVMGSGQSGSLLGSMQGAKADAIRRGVIEIIGPIKEEASHEKLQDVLYDSRQQNKYVELVENTRKDKIGDDYIYEGSYMVNLWAIESTLKAQGIIGDAGATVAVEDSTPADTGLKDTVSVDDVTIAAVEYDPPSADEMDFIKRYVDRMSFVVYFAEDVKEETKYIKAGIASANQFLIKKGYTVIDLDQVEKLKQDQQMVYEEETGESISIIQWIAQKLNADIYIEITGTTDGKTWVGGDYTATANVTAKAFDASTGTLVGQAVYNLPGKGMYSKASEEDARMAAMETVIYSQIMNNIETQIKRNMNKMLLAGIRYEVIFQNPPNDRVMSRFWSKVKGSGGIEAYELEYQSETEIKYVVWKIGSIEDLKLAFYDASESVSGLEDMYAVLARGKSITFNSGL